MPIIGSEGAASSGGFGQFARTGPANYIEEVFSTWLYTGNGATQTVTNGINVSGKGALIWVKNRTTSDSNFLFDTTRGAGQALRSNGVFANADLQSTINQTFSTTGFSFSTAEGYVNGNGNSFASWTFRKQPKFFDVVTYTGNGSTSSRLISHSLTSTPGFLIIKRTDSTSDWIVLARNSSGNYSLFGANAGTGLQTDDGAGVQNNAGLAAFVTSTTFNCVFPGGYITTAPNVNGATYVAYLFAHNAGGFGLSGSDNVISCSSFDTNGSGNATVSLGYEPQFVMMKRMNSESIGWSIFDSMRGWVVSGNEAQLRANASLAETSATDYGNPTATGFAATGLDASVTYMYLAIRRGPMKVPTSGSTVLFPTTNSAIGASDWSAAPLSEKSVDCLIGSTRTNSPNSGFIFTDRLRGLNGSYATSTSANLNSSSTSAESTSSYPLQLGDTQGSIGTNRNFPNSITYLLKRAPSFFDVVCYTGDGTVSRTIPHNLGVIPELAIAKCRSSGGVDTDAWMVASSAINYMTLNNTDASLIPSSSGLSGSTSSVFDPTGCRNSYNYYPNISARTYVVYLFASCPGVSKVGSFTGTGATQVINCGFTGGARFVLIKATSTTGNWLVWDSARGIVAGNDPYLALNSTAAEVTNTDWVDTAATGFELSNAGGNLANSSGVSYVFLAIS